MSIALASTTQEMDHIFSRENEVQKWLDFEAALAVVQAELGLIPDSAARTISKFADVQFFDLDEMEQRIAKSVHPIMPMVNALSELCGQEHGEYVHWGATTQDVIDTGLILRIKEAGDVIRRDLEKLCVTLADRAREEKSTVMPGRTHAQHAVPISLGYKLAVYVDELKRHLTSLERLSVVVMQGQFGGAAGTLSSLGLDGLRVRKYLMKELGLGEPDITWHVARDRIASYSFQLALVAATLHRLGREIMELQRDEIGELYEPFHAGKVGSSTMPHKRNPAKAESLITLGGIVNGHISVALSGLTSIHERDKGIYSVELEYVSKIFSLTHRMISMGSDVVSGFTRDSGRMRQNIDMTRGFIFSENVMMKLAQKVGRQKAHDVLYEIAMHAFDSGESFQTLVTGEREVRMHLSESEMADLFDPQALIGSAEQMVDRVCADVGA